MPDRSIAAKINKPDEKGGTPFSIDLVPRRPLDGLQSNTVALTLKTGVTEGQVEKLQSMINLLVVDAAVRQGDDKADGHRSGWSERPARYPATRGDG